MEETETCENCKKAIPATKVGTHLAYCRRNVIKCNRCDQMYDKNFQEEHEQQFHMMLTCKDCSSQIHQKDLQKHSLVCQMRPKNCQYCELDVPAAQYSHHLKNCEARTTTCELCHKPISNKQLVFHKSTCLGSQIKKAGSRRPQNRSGISQFGFQDSLSQLQHQIGKEKQPSGFKKEKGLEKKPIADNFFNNKKQAVGLGKIQSKSQKKPEIKRQAQKNLSYLDDNLDNSYLYYPEEDFLDFQNGFSSFYGNEFPGKYYEPYRPQRQSQPRNRSFLNDSIDNIEEVSVEDQLLQQALLETQKKSRIAKSASKQLPSDFFSEDIMNSSFYGKDILDIQKQKAIQRQLQSKKRVGRRS